MDNSKEFWLMLDKAIEQQPNDFNNFNGTKNVQDQLQDMIDYDLTNFGALRFMVDIVTKLQINETPYYYEFDSMEQLWLAFVMKEKYNKVWTGKEWKAITK